MISIKKNIVEGNQTPTLAPLGDISRPDCLLIADSDGFQRLFSGRFLRRSPAKIKKMGLLDDFFYRSSLLKIKHDLDRNYDISAVLYPFNFEMAAWGIVLDRIGRIYEVRSREDGLLELIYQAGCCRGKQDWKRFVGSRIVDEEDEIRRFYNKIRLLFTGRIGIASSLGFGLWDTVWMTFDMERAMHWLENDPKFVHAVANIWKLFHVRAIHAMIDAGIKIILFREHPGGFSASENICRHIDPLFGDSYRELTSAARSRGALIFLDCDSNEMLETDYPLEWGFSGVGPLLFRDEEDLAAARKGLNENLMLIGSTQLSDLVPAQDAYEAAATYGSAPDFLEEESSGIQGTGLHREDLGLAS